MIINGRHLVALETEVLQDLGRDLLQMSPSGDGTGLTVQLTRREEEFLLQVGGLVSPEQALAVAILEARGDAGNLPGTLRHTYNRETRTFST